jgi:hypothetical protein
MRAQRREQLLHLEQGLLIFKICTYMYACVEGRRKREKEAVEDYS